MHGVRGAVICPPEKIGTPQQEIWIPRGSIKGGNGGGAGPTGYKLRPARVLARSLANMANNHRIKKPG